MSEIKEQATAALKKEIICKTNEKIQKVITDDFIEIENIDGILGEVMKDFLKNGCPPEYDEWTWLDMLLVKRTLIAADKMKIEGDTVSGMTDDVSPSSYVRWDENESSSRFILRQHSSSRTRL